MTSIERVKQKCEDNGGQLPFGDIQYFAEDILGEFVYEIFRKYSLHKNNGLNNSLESISYHTLSEELSNKIRKLYESN